MNKNLNFIIADPKNCQNCPLFRYCPYAHAADFVKAHICKPFFRANIFIPFQGNLIS